MNDLKRNVVFCGFSKEEQEKIKLKDVRESVKYKCLDEPTRFPYVLYVNDIDEATRHQGFAIVIKLNNNMPIIEFDRLYRAKLKKYEIIYIVNKLYNLSFKEKYSKIICISENSVYTRVFESNLTNQFNIYKRNYKNQKKVTKKVLEKIEKIKELIKNKDYITSVELSGFLNVSVRTVERYLNLMNDLYKNIGYDKEKKRWYIIK